MNEETKLEGNDMKASKQLCAKKGWLPQINFRDGKLHTIKLVGDEARTLEQGIDGKPVEGVDVAVIEDGVKKGFFTGARSLIIEIAGCKTGDTLKVQMLRENKGSGVKCNFVVERV